MKEKESRKKQDVKRYFRK